MIPTESYPGKNVNIAEVMKTLYPFLSVDDQGDESMFADIEYNFKVDSIQMLGWKPDPFLKDLEGYPLLAHIEMKYTITAVSTGDENNPTHFEKSGTVYYIGTSFNMFYNSFVILFSSCFKDKQSSLSVIEFAVDALIENSSIVYNPVPSIYVSLVTERREPNQSTDVVPLSLIVVEGLSWYPNIHGPEYDPDDVFKDGTMLVQGAAHDVLVCEVTDQPFKFTDIRNDIRYCRLGTITDHFNELHVHYSTDPDDSIKIEVFTDL